MSDECKAWLRFGLLGLLIAFGIPTACTAHHNHRAADLLERGVSGYDVRCALMDGSSDRDVACVLAREEDGD